VSVAAVLLVKNEEDVIDYTIRHLLAHVDHIIVADNMSTDGTREILESHPVEIVTDREVGYYQSKKTTDLAVKAMRAGFNWVLPCDADELWYPRDERPIRDYLDGVAPDVRIVKADLYNHLPSGDDDPGEANPFLRIRWRQRQHAPIGKVCVRMGSDITIHQGNHNVSHNGLGLAVPGLVVRHFSWRSEQQYLNKIRTGSAAYAATDLDASVGAHWRMFDAAEDQAIVDHFTEWFYFNEPREDDSLMFDPAPYAGGSILAAKEG